MQRECNVVAFGELILSTRLKHKHENNTSKVRNQKMSSKHATLGTCRCRKGSPPQEGVAFTTVLQRIARVFTNQYVDSSNMSLALETLNTTRTVRCAKPAKDKTTAARWQSRDTIMMMTKKATWG